MSSATRASTSSGKGDTKRSDDKQRDIRLTNLVAARSVADAIRTSLGPKGMDKMITDSGGDVIITNDGATILSKMEVRHPAAKMLVELSKSQDIEAGDGTTSVVVIAGALLEKAEELLEKGIHPMALSDAWKLAAAKSCSILRGMSYPVQLRDKSQLIKSAVTSLSSKVVSQYSNLLAPLAVDAVMHVIDEKSTNVDLREIRVVTRLGDTIENTELINGLVFNQEASKGAGGPTRIENPRIALVQFQISPPKTDMENQLVVGNQQEIDRIARDEKKYILNIVKKILKCKCNVILLQKSILRDAVNILGAHYLAKKNIMVIKDIERDEMSFIARSLGCKPVASPDHLTEDKLGFAQLAEEVYTSGGRIVKITGVANPGKTVSILVRGSNNLVLEEAERSLHDALCVVRSLVKERSIIAGGGAPETQVSVQLAKYAETLGGLDAYCVQAFADALEVIPYTLAENAGLNPIKIFTKLRKAHSAANNAQKDFGIDIKKGDISDMYKNDVIQPLLVNLNAINLATEFVRMILKVDDIITTR
eukprot:CAMPEP_0202686408 /NCGR_PEP_ID=MMETSP1385-20130828/2203_1 /ASSEMBLY_ACC=CAM_ASM_000861 /TAXON_ID=933848 /ORGANISM="Elphidium margaritaceum" /LENGTH=535 /DNA_ID=CAMNT_0049340975 /DNA_START=1836 /DNA_END=3443 /DNA_ORIENTATION=-